MASMILGIMRANQRKILEKFKKAGACSPETAVTLACAQARNQEKPCL